MDNKSKNRYRRKQEEKDATESSATLKNSRSTKEEPFRNKSHFDLEDFDGMQFDREIRIKEYLFNHTFNQYVRMTLVKILPLTRKDMVINQRQSSLKGPPEECEKFKNLIERQLERYAMKMIRFHKDQDIDEIQFNLKPEYDVKVYRIKYVELASREVAKHFDYKIEAVNLIQKMKTQKQILVRIIKEYVDKCVLDINEIVNASREREDNYSPSNEKGNITIASFVTVRPDTSGLSESKIISSNSGSSESINESNEEDGPSFYEIPGIVKQIPKKKEEKKVEPKRHSISANILSGYLSEPTEEDSVSVVERKKTRKVKSKDTNYPENSFQKNKPEVKPPKELIEVKRYEIFQQEFDEKDFRNWQKDRRILQLEEVQIQKEADPYDDNCFRFIIKLLIPSTTSKNEEDDKKEALDYYFKFKKVIFIKLKNDAYKNQLIKQYTKTEDSLTIEFVKGFKSPKWKQNIMWSHILKKNYTAEKKSANTEPFEAFFLQGLKSLVMEAEQDLRQKLTKQPMNDVEQEIIFKIDEIRDHFRDNETVRSLIKKHVLTAIPQTFSYICKVKEAKFVLSDLKVVLIVKFDKQNQFHNSIKNEILSKLRKDLHIQRFEASFIIDKFTFEKLSKAVAILQRDEKGFTFISSSVELAQNFNKINSIINSVNTINESEIKINDIHVGKQINLFINDLLKETEFVETKFNANIDKNTYVFKFYGRGYILDSLLDKIKKFKEEIQQNRLSYFQLVKLKEKEVVNNQDFINKIHEKYNILLQPTESHLSCRIIIVGENEPFKKKIISIKKTKILDYTPIDSIFVFRSAAEVDGFNSSWAKTFKNFMKKHNQGTPFTEKSRNYTLVIKSGSLTQTILREALDLKENFSKIVMVMQENDKQVFIRDLVTVLIEEKQYSNRQVQILLLQQDENANLKHLLGFEEHTKEREKKNEDKTTTKYYVTEKTQKFYYSSSGNKKIQEAVKLGKGTVILDNEDLNITHNSHQFNKQASCIIHLQSNTSLPVTVHPNRVEYTLKGKVYEMPQKEVFKVQQSLQLNIPAVDLSLGVYEINFEKMEQVNVFSGYVRNLLKEVMVVKVDKTFERMQVFYDAKIGQIGYHYTNDIPQENLFKVGKEVDEFLAGNIKTKEFSLKHIPNITKQDIAKLQQDIEQDQTTECIYKQSNEALFVKLFDEHDFLKVEWRIKYIENNYLNNQIKQNVKYPETWQPQKDEIQEFVVPEGSIEYNKIQNIFKVGKIKVLIRIQNKIIYKKYYEEGLFLKNLNNGTSVKKMELFHGTNTTNPEQIYRDKEESFNINYSSNSNLLGRGIYFAQKSEYSNSYRYTEQVISQGMLPIFSKNTNLYSMFLCEVYVGESQKCLKHNGEIKDTSFRDPTQKIRYESMTDFLVNSNIYVVYKSRRAYPLYLIKY